MSDERPHEPHRSWFGRLMHLLNGEPQNREELMDLIQGASERGLLDSEALTIIESTLQVSERQVREIMIPRAQMLAVRDDDELKDILPVLIDSAHSRFPVLSADDPDEVIGILFAKDLLKLLAEQRPPRFDLKDYLRPAFFVPESTHLDRLIREFRTKKSHMAIVVNEYGGVAGLVTLEDALEQIVGDIDDEHDYDDEEDVLIKEIAPNEFVIKALTPIEEFNDFFHAELSSEDFETLGGIIMNAFERLPEREEQIRIEDFNFTVLAADSRTIRLLKVQRV